MAVKVGKKSGEKIVVKAVEVVGAREVGESLEDRRTRFSTNIASDFLVRFSGHFTAGLSGRSMARLSGCCPVEVAIIQVYFHHKICTYQQRNIHVF